MHRHQKRRITAKQGAIMLTRQEIDSSGSVSVFSGELGPSGRRLVLISCRVTVDDVF